MTQESAAPSVTIGATHAVRDLRASVLQASLGYTTILDILQNGVLYCSLEIDSENTNSTAIADGIALPPLLEGASVTVNVMLNPLANFSGTAIPPRDLTVTVRL